MQKTWVLIADTTRARVFAVEKPLGPLQEFDTLVHTESRLHEQDLTTDRRPGRNSGANGGTGHSVGHEDDPKRHEGAKFAKDVCSYLEDAHLKGQFERLYLVAAPTFLGGLRRNLSKGVSQSLAREIPKNVTRLDSHAIRDHLPERL